MEGTWGEKDEASEGGREEVETQEGMKGASEGRSE